MLHEFESELNKATDSATFASLGSGILGSFLLLTPFSAVGLIGLGASFGSFATAVLLKSKSKEGIKKVIQGIEHSHSVEVKTYKDTLLLKDNQIAQLQGELTQKSDELNKCLRDLSLAVKALQAAKDKEGDYLQGLEMIADMKASLKQCITEALEIFQDGYESFFTPKRLKDYPELLRRKEESEGLLSSIRGEFEQTDDCLELLRIYFWLNEGYRTQGIKNAKSLIIASSKDKEIELNQWDSAYQELVRERDELAAKHLTEITNLKAQLKEYMNGWIQELENERDSSDVQVRKQLDLITMLSQQVEALKQPFSYKSPTRPDMRIANTVIEYFWAKERICLDRAGSDYRGHEATLEFNAERTGRLILASELNDHSEALQAMIHTLNKPEFKLDPETGLLTLLIRWANKPKADTSDINKLWVPSSKFEQTVKGWSRIRLTGGSESGKSPTAENLAVAILKNRPGIAKLYNPQHDSVKNYWTIPVVGTSHSDSEKGIAALATQVDLRANGQQTRDEFELSIFDEVDSTMSHTKGKKAAIGGNVNFIIKQASHQNLGAIFIGQNANVSEYPGMDRSDWNSAVNVHIGANAYDAITNSNRFTPEEVNKLKQAADKITEFCNDKNTELGLEKTDPQAYRFALVVEPNKKPYFIELPAFGTYTYDQLQQRQQAAPGMETTTPDDSRQSLGALKTRITSASPMDIQSGYVGSGCPGCGSANRVKAGKYQGRQRYQCKDCGKRYTEGE